MSELLARIKQNNFLVIGRVGMDIYTDPPDTKTEDARAFVACLGGSSANTAVAIVKLGGKASLVTCVSDDAVGRFCLKELDRYGVDRSHVRTVAGEARTSLAVIETRVEDHQSVIYRNNAADFLMQEDDVAALDYGQFGALISTGTVFAASPSRESGFAAFAAAKAAGLPIIFDIDYRPYSWQSRAQAADIYGKAARYCDMIMGNDEEFGVMAGGDEKGLALAERLARETATIVVYKMGEKGSITFAPDGERIETASFRVTALKPTGAGDSFMGAFVASLAAGYPIARCVVRASAAAAIVVSRMGCAPAMPKAREIEAFLEQHQSSSAA